MQDSAFIDLGDFYFKLTSSIFQTMVDLFHKPILKAVKKELPLITDFIHKEVQTLNYMLTHKNESSFMVPIFDPAYPLNLTMTKAPEVNSNTQLININFDGTFYDKAEKTNHVDRPTVYFQRVEG